MMTIGRTEARKLVRLIKGEKPRGCDDLILELQLVAEMPPYGWHDVERKAPPPNARLDGYDVFYGGIFCVTWDGTNRTDDGFPFLVATGKRGDDYYIRYWRKLPWAVS